VKDPCINYVALIKLSLDEKVPKTTPGERQEKLSSRRLDGLAFAFYVTLDGFGFLL
jgi:hypothetical protein